MRPLSASLVCAAMLVAAPASAQVESTGTASGLRYTLGDLRPDDGQAPAVGFSPGRRSLSATGIVADASGHILYQDAQELSELQDLTAAVSSKDMLKGSAMLVPTGQQFEMDGGSVLAQIAAGHDQGRFAEASLEWDEVFRLAPYSSLTLSLDVDVRTHIVPDGSGDQYASSGANLVGYGDFSDGQLNSQVVYDGAFALAYVTETVANPDAQDAKTLTITLVNPNASWGDGHFYFDLGVNTHLNFVPATPVPEPDERMLLGAGLGLLALGGAAARRRKKRGAAAPLLPAQA